MSGAGRAPSAGARLVVAVLAASLTMGRALAAQTDTATRRCDAVIAAAKADSVLSGVFIDVREVEGPYLAAAALKHMALEIGSAFELPKPLSLSVFAGPARTHLLRPVGGDTLPDLRAPSVIGIYAAMTVPHDRRVYTAIDRATLMPGFDDAVLSAVQVAASDTVFHPSDDTLRFVVRFATDSVAGAVRLVMAYFPRMPVVDAVALPGNRPAPFPDSAHADGADRGEVLLRFVVTRDGLPALNTLEILRATSAAFLSAAVNALPDQHFRPATIRGCGIAELIEYPFTFVRPDAPPTGRH